MGADYCVNFESLSETMQIRLVGANLPSSSSFYTAYA